MPTVLAEPIGPTEAASLFAGLDRPLAIAVSGGVDSMALMHLVAAWRRQGGGADSSAPLVLTIDHGLRPASAEEALFVGAAARQLGLDHDSLVWTGTKPTSGIQDAARRARYDLLLNRLAIDEHPRDLLLAHTQEDQAETLIMRLARGSGLDGLSAMRPLESRVLVKLGCPVREAIVRLRRPLLDIPKARLIATLRAFGGDWREDPTNADVRYERVRLRRSQMGLAELGLTPDSIARSARRLAAERTALNARTAEIAAEQVRDHAGAYGELTLPPGNHCQPADLARILARLIGVFGGAAPAAQLSQIEALVDRVQSPSLSAEGRLTLGGCIVDIAGGQNQRRSITAFREVGRGDLPTLILQPGEGVFWDRRFYISLSAQAAGPVRIMPCSTAGNPHPAGPRGHWAALPAIGPEGSSTLLFGRNDLPATCVWPMQHAAAVAWRDVGDVAAETI